MYGSWTPATDVMLLIIMVTAYVLIHALVSWVSKGVMPGIVNEDAIMAPRVTKKEVATLEMFDGNCIDCGAVALAGRDRCGGCVFDDPEEYDDPMEGYWEYGVNMADLVEDTPPVVSSPPPPLPTDEEAENLF